MKRMTMAMAAAVSALAAQAMTDDEMAGLVAEDIATPTGGGRLGREAH